MPSAFAPGKCILFGEHAVVYGQPALACSINQRMTIELEKTPGGKERLARLAERWGLQSKDAEEEEKTKDTTEDQPKDDRHLVDQVGARAPVVVHGEGSGASATADPGVESSDDRMVRGTGHVRHSAGGDQ